jgi:hypothetical protein
MSVNQHPAALQGIDSGAEHLTNPSRSIHCALLSFAVSVSSFIGVALLLVSI